MPESSSTITTTAVAVGTTAVALNAASGVRERIIVQNVHATQILYVGDSTVTTASGIRIGPNESREFETFRGVIYGIASGAATDTRVAVIS